METNPYILPLLQLLSVPPFVSFLWRFACISLSLQITKAIVNCNLLVFLSGVWRMDCLYCPFRKNGQLVSQASVSVNLFSPIQYSDSTETGAGLFFMGNCYHVNAKKIVLILLQQNLCFWCWFYALMGIQTCRAVVAKDNMADWSLTVNVHRTYAWLVCYH